MVDVQQNGDAHLLIDVNEVLHHLLGGHGVEGGNRLVRQNDAGALGKRPSQRHALLLAAGAWSARIYALSKMPTSPATERLELCPLCGTRPARRRGRIRHAGGEHILDHGRARDQVERLERRADARRNCRSALPGKGAHIRAVHRQRAGGDPGAYGSPRAAAWTCQRRSGR